MFEQMVEATVHRKAILTCNNQLSKLDKCGLLRENEAIWKQISCKDRNKTNSSLPYIATLIEYLIL
jgi:hypothetical protein